MTPQEIIGLDEKLRAQRSNLLNRWQEIAELVAPHEADFTVSRQPGELRGLMQDESAPAVAAENLANGLWALLTNPATEWFAIRPEDPLLMESGDVLAWCESARRLMLLEFLANGQAFYSKMLDFNRSLVRYGTALLYVDQDAVSGRMRYWAPSLRECVVMEDDEGRVDFVSRRWTWTARQAYQRFGDKLPEAIKKHLERQPESEHQFVHVVRPNKDRDPRRKDYRGKPWLSCYVSVTGQATMEEAGLDRLPWIVGRWAPMNGTPYGYSPAMVALADIKTLNVMAKTFLVASQKAADPPILAADENALGPVRIRPGGIIYGAIDANGNRRMAALESAGNFALTDAMLAAKREAVKEAFLTAQLSMPDKPNRTATEILQREEDRMRLMAPNLVRMQAEVLDGLIETVFQAMMKAGAFPPPPPELLEAGGAMMVEYVSPLARAQRASEGQAILRVFENVMAFAQQRPEVLDNFDLDRAARRLAETLGLPGDLMRDWRRVLQQRQAGAQAAAAASEEQQAMEGAALLPDMARAARDFEQAPGVMQALGVPMGSA